MIISILHISQTFIPLMFW